MEASHTSRQQWHCSPLRTRRLEGAVQRCSLTTTGNLDAAHCSAGLVLCVGHYVARFGRRPARPGSDVSLEREGFCSKRGHSRTL
eukprot:5150909-Pyramimonas_sp.AAC.1